MLDFGQPSALSGGGGGARQGGAQGFSLASPANSTGGKAIIKYNPTQDEIANGIRSEATLFSWESPDGQPHFVTVEVGRVVGGVGGPTQDGSPGQTPISNIGGAGGGTFPAGLDAAGNPYYYRASARILLGTPGTMQDAFFIDINRGQRFTACVSYVAVTAAMSSTPRSEETGDVIIPNPLTGKAFVSGSLVVYASLGVGFAPSLAPVLYTQYIDLNSTDAPAGTYTRFVPPRANRLISAQSTNGGAPLKVEFGSPGADGFITPPFTNGEMGQFNGDGLSISGDGDLLELTSTSGVPAGYKLVYQISV